MGTLKTILTTLTNIDIILMLQIYTIEETTLQMKKKLIFSAALVLSLGLAGCGADSAKEEKPKEETQKAVSAEAEKPQEKAKEDSVPREYKAALKKAESYAENMQMSKAGIYDQLTSEHGEKFPAEAAQYAIDNIVFDWKENALKKAQSYAENMSMSDSDIYDQLVSEHGEKFTAEEAKYAIDNLK